MYSKVDKLIINEIKNKIDTDKEYFSYNDISKKEGIHNYARYPATMVPEMQKDILEIILKNTQVKRILDPFMGSGTVLVEGIKNGLDIYGLDINPYAYYLTKVKLTYLNIEILKDLHVKLLDSINDEKYEYKLHNFDNIDKWFRKDYQHILSKIRHSILEIEDYNIRLFFLLTFSDVVTSLKNSQSSTFKLHVKPSEKIENFNKNAIKEFVFKLNQNVSNYENFICEMREKELIKRKYKNMAEKFRSKVKISCGDSRELKNLLGLRNNSIDLIVTSPPYGDNKTTVTYGQYSSLPLLWMLNEEMTQDFDNKLLENYSSIDSASLGGKIYTKENIMGSEAMVKSKKMRQFYELMVDQNREDKGRKVASFLIDFNDVLLQLYDILKKNGYMVFVVGNRRVHNEKVPFDDIIEELLYGKFTKITDFDRLIKNKKMALCLSKVENETVKSMDTERILIFKKNS